MKRNPTRENALRHRTPAECQLSGDVQSLLTLLRFTEIMRAKSGAKFAPILFPSFFC